MRHQAKRVKAVCLALIVITATTHASAQHHHGDMATSAPTLAAQLQVRDGGDGNLVVRLGPVNLTHGSMFEAQGVTFTVPFDGWFTAYHPRMVNAAGDRLPGSLLHHVAFWNLNRKDFLCPGHNEHIFGAGGEMNDWPKLPGIGYRVRRGDQIRITSMFHDPSDMDYPDAYLEVQIEYTRADAGEPLRSVYPAWFDVKECGDSSFDIPAGQTVRTGTFTLLYSGTLLGAGGHLHDYGRQLVLTDAARKRHIAVLDAETDAAGRLLSMPVKTFGATGYRINKGDVVAVTARYDNTSGHDLPQGAMGIVVGYFMPDDDAPLATLRSR